MLTGFFICSSSQASQPLSANQICRVESIMATAWSICLYDTGKTRAELDKAIDLGMEEIKRIDRWMSEWKPESEISMINSNAGIKPVKVSDEAVQVLSLCLDQSEKSGGAFDISFNTFFGQYNWKKGHEKFPSEAKIKELLPLVNYKNIIVDKTAKTVFLKNKGMKIGLGGMGQGYAVDKVVELLRPIKIQSGYVDGSGDTYFWGRKPNGKLWTVGVGDPRLKQGDTSKSVVYKLYITDMAVTTAGDTEHFFVRHGKRFHHIIDPQTGYSADRSAQVTAFCKTATLCDLSDDTVFILGPEKGKKFAEDNKIDAVIVDPNGKITLTKGLKPIETKWGPALEMLPTN